MFFTTQHVREISVAQSLGSSFLKEAKAWRIYLKRKPAVAEVGAPKYKRSCIKITLRETGSACPGVCNALSFCFSLKACG